MLQAVRGGKAGADACERVHLDFLRKLMGVRDTSSLLVLSETGRMPLVTEWARQIARFVSRLLSLDDSRVAKKYFLDSLELASSGAAAGRGRQCWADEVRQILTSLGGQTLCPSQLPDSIDDEEIAQAATDLHIARYHGSTAPVMVARYQEQILGAPVDGDTYYSAAYLSTVPRRRRRESARVRTGCCDWLAEDTGRIQHVARTDRGCPHCGAPLQYLQHALIECPLYVDMRSEYSDLLEPNMSVTAPPGWGGSVEYIEFCGALPRAVARADHGGRLR